MSHEITVPLQEIKAVLSGTRRVQNGLRMKTYWSRVSKAGLNASLLTGSNEISLEVDVDAYGEPSSDGGPIEITHRFQGGILSKLGIPQDLLLYANRLRTTVEAETTERLTETVQMGLKTGEQVMAVATLQSAARTVTKRAEDLSLCTERLNCRVLALESRSQQLLNSPDALTEESITQMIHRKTELAKRQAGLEAYQGRLRHRLEVAQQRIQESGLPEVVGVAAMVSGLKQAGKNVDVETEGATVIDTIILKLADRIAFR